MEEVIRLSVGAFQTNCYLLKKDHHVLIIDPGAGAAKIQSRINENEIVDAIILTHGHFDHIGAVDKLQAHYQCPVYLNPKDEKLAKDEKLNSMAHFSAVIHCPTQKLQEGNTRIGIFDLIITEAPGHTSGSTVIQFKNHLFTGDVLFKRSIGRTDLYSGNASEMKRSLQLFYSMDENLIVYPGHEDITILRDEIMYNPYL